MKAERQKKAEQIEQKSTTPEVIAGQSPKDGVDCETPATKGRKAR